VYLLQVNTCCALRLLLFYWPNPIGL